MAMQTTTTTPAATPAKRTRARAVAGPVAAPETKAQEGAQGNGKGGTPSEAPKNAPDGVLAAPVVGSDLPANPANPAKAKKARIYAVKGPDGKLHLVRAYNKVRALLHLASTEYSAEVANSEDMYEAGRRGEEMLDATGDDEVEITE